MNWKPLHPPRKFKVGETEQIELTDCGQMQLAPNELITFTTESQKQYDVTRKNWGFYATPSLNGRLVQFDLRAALVKNIKTQLFFILLVEKDHESEFETYLQQENMIVISWLDQTGHLLQMEQKLTDKEPL